MGESNFEWDELKNLENQQKHGVSFFDAQHAFFDQNRVIAEDLAHSQKEQRFYCCNYSAHPWNPPFPR